MIDYQQQQNLIKNTRGRATVCALHMCVTLHVLDGEGSRVFASRAVVAQMAMYLTIYSD